MTRPEEEPRRSDEDAIWRDIVASYGERPEFPDVEPEPAPEPVAAAPAEPEYEATWEDEGHYVPPEPPPAPRPRGPRGLAWVGVFGMPLLMIVLAIVRWSPPSWLSLMMIAWFVGGFGYLVATMGAGSEDDGWDDGAVL